MSGWIESYRSAVAAWECDQFGHMNVQFYLGHSLDALAWTGAAVGLPPSVARAEGRVLVPSEDRVLFKRELRAGAAFHMRSGIRAADAEGLSLSIEILNSETGQLAAQLERRARLWDVRAARYLGLDEATLAAARGMEAPADLAALPPETPAAPPHDHPRLIESSRGSINKWEMDPFGFAHLRFRMNAYTSAMPHVVGRIGFTTEAREENGWGFAALDYKIDHRRPIKVGEPYTMRSGLFEMKEKTMRLVHHMVQASSGESLGSLEFVIAMFDLRARRAMPIPPAMRELAGEMLIGG